MWLFFFSCSESLGRSLAIVGDDSLTSCDFDLVLRRLEVCGEGGGGWDCCCDCVCEGVGSDAEGLLCWIVEVVGVDGGDDDEGGGGMGSVFISFESAVGMGLVGDKHPPRAEGFLSEVGSDEHVSAGTELVVAGEVTKGSVSVPAIETFPGSGV